MNNIEELQSNWMKHIMYLVLFCDWWLVWNNNSNLALYYLSLLRYRYKFTKNDINVMIDESIKVNKHRYNSDLVWIDLYSKNDFSFITKERLLLDYIVLHKCLDLGEDSYKIIIYIMFWLQCNNFATTNRLLMQYIWDINKKNIEWLYRIDINKFLSLGIQMLHGDDIKRDITCYTEAIWLDKNYHGTQISCAECSNEIERIDWICNYCWIKKIQ